MGVASNSRWDALENRAGTVFFVAGVLLLIPGANYLLEVFTTMSFEGPVTGIPAFLGIILSFVGVAGLYPRLREEAPRLALVGLVIGAAPAVFLSVLLVYFVLTLAVTSLPPASDLIPAPDLVFRSIFVLFATGGTLLAAAGLQENESPRTVGSLLLLYTSTWYVLIGSSLVFGGGDLPPWIDLVTFVLLAAATLSLGVTLRTGYAPLDRTPTRADSAA